MINNKTHKILFSSNKVDHFNVIIKKHYPEGKVFVVTDFIVDNLYHETVKEIFTGYDVNILIANKKDLNSYKKITDQLLSLKMKKSDLLVAFGGGTIGDLVGFVAATLYRGIKYIQIPTTLLAQIDSSVGGKNGLDTSYGKNLLGSFYYPFLVLIDNAFLKTLVQREYNNGLAEAIKMAVLFDEDLYQEILKKDRLSLKNIKQIVNYKKQIVKQDFSDQGVRRFLNFGHTFGHIIEKTNNYQEYKHGEAISHGMLIALLISEKKGYQVNGIYEELLTYFKKHQLIETPISNYQKYFKDLTYDKKNENGKISLIGLEKIAKPVIIKLKDDEL